MLLSANQKINGTILVIISALSLSISMSLVKQLNSDIPTLLAVFIRSCFGLLFLMPFLRKNPIQAIRTIKLRLHILRSILTLGAMFCTYYAYRHLPIAFATSIGMSGPLFTITLSVIILKDHIGLWKWVLVLIGYCGVILVIRPTSFIVDIAIIVALLANILSSCCIIIAKILSKNDSTITIMLYSNIGITIISALLNNYQWQILDIRDIIILSLAGLLGIISQFCTFKAFKYSNPSFLAPFEYTRMLFAILISIFIFQEQPDLFTIIGGIIIISSILGFSTIPSKINASNRNRSQ